jgi:N-acetylglutamate synthase-like GNAT family acetyltransferase
MIRPITYSDYNQYKKLIDSNFTISYFNYFIDNIINKNHIIYVYEKDNIIIACGTLLIEYKLTHGGCKMGHIENIFVEESHRGKGFGTEIVNFLKNELKNKKCYRIDLICSEDKYKFYNYCGFNIKQSGCSLLIPENYNQPSEE